MTCPRTKTTFGFVDEGLESRDLQEAAALRDGIDEQETIGPADGRLQRGHRALLDKVNHQRHFRSATQAVKSKNTVPHLVRLLTEV